MQHTDSQEELTNLEKELNSLQESAKKKIIWSHHILSVVLICLLIIMSMIGFDGGLKNTKPNKFVILRSFLLDFIEHNKL